MYGLPQCFGVLCSGAGVGESASDRFAVESSTIFADVKTVVEAVGGEVMDEKSDVVVLKLCKDIDAASHRLSQLTAWLPDSENAQLKIKLASRTCSSILDNHSREKLKGLANALSEGQALDKNALRTYLSGKTFAYKESWNTVLDPTAATLYMSMIPDVTGAIIAKFIAVVQTFAEQDHIYFSHESLPDV
jgi:hypothetical protein